jgi:hypothetical protein
MIEIRRYIIRRLRKKLISTIESEPQALKHVPF